MPPYLNRRQVLTGAGAMATAVSASLGRATRGAQQADAVVIGCGAAGMTAALRGPRGPTELLPGPALAATVLRLQDRAG